MRRVWLSSSRITTHAMDGMHVFVFGWLASLSLWSSNKLLIDSMKLAKFDKPKKVNALFSSPAVTRSASVTFVPCQKYPQLLLKIIET